MKKVLLASLSVLLTIAALPAAAATFVVGETVSLAEPASEDAYVVGSQILINHSIGGDLVSAGGTMTINGAVAQDALLAGGNLNLNATVADDLRAAGGSLSISQNIGDDVLAAAGVLTLAKEVTVSGDALIAGGQVIVDGAVTGNTRVMAGDLFLNGMIGGTADLRADRLIINGSIGQDSILVARQIVLGPKASFAGNVRYWNESGVVDFAPHLTTGTATMDRALAFSYRTARNTDALFVWFVVAAVITSLLSSMLILALLIGMTKTFFDRSAKHLTDHFWMDLGLGLLYLLVTPLAAMVLMATVIGLPIGLFVLMLYVFSLAFMRILAALVIAKWFELRSKKPWSKTVVFFAATGILVVLSVIGIIPIVGWFIAAFVPVAALGALLVTKYQIERRVL